MDASGALMVVAVGLLLPVGGPTGAVIVTWSLLMRQWLLFGILDLIVVCGAAGCHHSFPSDHMVAIILVYRLTFIVRCDWTLIVSFYSTSGRILVNNVRLISVSFFLLIPYLDICASRILIPGYFLL